MKYDIYLIMVIIDTIKGNLLDSNETYICQQCNCNTIKAHGLSKSISNKYTWANIYKIRPKKHNNSTTHPDEPGTIIELEHPNNHHKVLCFMGQWLPGKPRVYKNKYSTTYILPENNVFKGPVLPVTGKYTTKDQLKSNMANCFIGRGSPRSSTQKYSNAWGEHSNKGYYSVNDIVFVSAEGNRKHRASVDENELDKALAARAVIIADEKISRDSFYNIGEREIFERVTAANYIEYPCDSGHWFPPNYDDSYENRKLWFKNCLEILDENPYNRVAMPYGIGCGLAGGKWSEYKKMLDECSTNIIIYQL